MSITTMAHVTDTSSSAHLHLSITWIEEKQKLRAINWQNIVQYETIRLIDPMDFIINSPEIIKRS